MLLISLALSPSFANSPREHRYYGTFMGDSVLLREPARDGDAGELIYADDAHYPARFCGESSPYICIFSDRLAFAVPKQIDGNTNRWSFEGVEFERIRDSVSVDIVGRRFQNLMLIKTDAATDAGGRDSGKSNYFLYSHTTGLVAFGRAQSPTQSIIFWMEGSVGFGAVK